MTLLERVLVVGGGIGGMSAALCLRRQGVAVDLVERDAHWRVYGAGITITGPSLRAFQALGFLDAIAREGSVQAGVRLFASTGRHVADMPPQGSDVVHSGGGIMRPVLHRLLGAAVREAGVGLSLGNVVRELDDRADGVHVLLSDGRRERYDLVIGADGLYSSIRALAFPEVPAPTATGQGCFRVFLPREPEVTGATMVVGGPVPIGFVPVSESHMYMFLLAPAEQKVKLEAAECCTRLRELMSPYGGIAGRVRDAISETSEIVYRRLEALLVPSPWARGRVLLLGDAAHATTPHLASGAGLAVEDALVLAEELGRASTLQEALAAHCARRQPRCKLVVETSVAIGAHQLSGAPAEQIFGLMQATSVELAKPY